MPKRWIIRRFDPGQAQFLASEASISDLLASLLIARGVLTADAAKAFLNTNLKDHLREPFLLPGCKDVAEKLLFAVKVKQKIVVYGDYDVDGMTGIVILRQTLKDLGGDVDFYVPSRLDEGYGLNSEALERLAKEGANVVVTVDCGITSIEEAETAKRLGLTLLVTDHHTPERQLPAAAAIAHPQLVRNKDSKDDNKKWVSEQSLSLNEARKAERYPFPFLCGAAVALKVAWGLGQLAHEGPGKPVTAAFRERLKEMLGLAAMGTVADFVPLLDENRALVRGGLPFLTMPNASPGLRNLLAIAKFDKEKQPITSEYVAFQLAPRLNAAGRLGQAGLAVELLLSDDRERTAELATEIDHLNESRKRLERQIYKEAERQIFEKFSPDDPAFVLAGDWHRGVIGIVAGRIADRFHRPTILLGKDSMGLNPAVGSARSVSNFNLYNALQSCEAYLVRFGGHSAAAGLTIEAQNIETFRKAFCDVCAAGISEEERTAELLLDGTFPLGAFTPNAVKQILSLAPFGNANQSPVFAAENVTAQNVKPMGQEENHFSAEFCQGGVTLRGIAFTRGEWIEKMKPYSEPLDIAFKVKISSYNGRVELNIVDWRRSQEPGIDTV
jgi:single-stranded-DNA-specific exonuclease